MAGEPPRQLALDLPPMTSAARADFVAAPCNARALALVDRWPDWPARAQVLFGPEGVGKSHLAAIWAARAHVPRVALADLERQDLMELTAHGAVAIEDIAPDIADAALFHLLNLVRERGVFLLLTARQHPAAATYRLPDLASRLRAIPTTELGTPDESLLAALVVKLFADRGVEADEPLVRYLIPRVDRTVPALRAAVAAIDAAALAARRPVTRALAAQVLRANEPGDAQ